MPFNAAALGTNFMWLLLPIPMWRYTRVWVQDLVWLRPVLKKGFHFLELPEAIAQTPLSGRQGGKEFLPICSAVLPLRYIQENQINYSLSSWFISERDREKLKCSHDYQRNMSITEPGRALTASYDAGSMSQFWVAEKLHSPFLSCFVSLGIHCLQKARH